MVDGATTDPDLHLLVDGHRVTPVDRGQGTTVFRISGAARTIRLMSHAVVPFDIGLNDDRRVLGYAVRRFVIVQAGRATVIPSDSPDLFDGYYDSEPQGFRWTNGSAAVPGASRATADGEIELTVQGFGLPNYGVIDSDKDADRRLFLAFESVGENCEFAFAQREYGAQPVGLFRWGSVDIARLQAGLQCRFTGLGDPAAVSLEWIEDIAEYRLRDPRYFTAHTGIGERANDAEEELELVVRTCARLHLLRRKLISDIAAATRILVFKTARPEIGVPEFRDLHRAVHSIGPSRLLCVRQAPPGVAAGTVEDAGGGLLLGYIDQFVEGTGPYTMWRTLCRNALSIAAPRD